MRKNTIVTLTLLFISMFIFNMNVYAESAVAYAQDGASADGKRVYCGSEIYINNKETDCYMKDSKEVCKYSKINGRSESGIVYRNKLNAELGDLTCSNERVTKHINDVRYLQSLNSSNAFLEEGHYCGEALNITECYRENNGTGDEWCSVKDTKWLIRSAGLATSPDAAKAYCGGDYNVLFDENYGYGLSCNNGTTYYSDGVCQAVARNKSKQKFPVTVGDKALSREGQGLLIGWTKAVWNGAPLCQGGDGSVTEVTINKTDYTDKITGDTVYYACYEEAIGGYRYLLQDAAVDGGAALECGDKFWVDYCNYQEGKEYCYGIRGGVTRKLDRTKIVSSPEVALASCTDSNVGYKYASEVTENYSCGEQVYITSCNNSICSYSQVKKSDGSISSVSGQINRNSLYDDLNSAKNNCTGSLNDNEFKNKKSCSGLNTTKQSKIKGKVKYSNFCYNENDTKDDIIKEMSKKYKCASGYSVSNVYNLDEENRCNDHGICINNFSFTCRSNDETTGIRPTLEVTSGIVGDDGYGTIKVKASASEGSIVKYFVSEEYMAPTLSDEGWIKTNGQFTVTSTPGIKYIWVMDSNGNVSYGVSGAVLDTKNTNTTIGKLELYDDNNNIQTPGRVAYDTSNIKSNKYVLMSNDFSKDSKVLADGFNPFDMEYKLEVESATISVYATLTSKDSKYVDGYEPRTVNLKYGINTILIKIQNNEGKIRTYTILVTRKDDRTSDNTLSDLKVSVGKINFNSNVTDYKVEVPKNTESVDVSAVVASDKANYVEGYEPGIVYIDSDTKVKLIKVKSQTGSTRTYVITFVREGTDIISDKTLQLSDLVIPNVYLPFETDVSNYSISVGYENDSLDLKMVLRDENSYSIVSYKRKSDNEFKVGSASGIPLDVGENFIEIKVTNSNNVSSYYRITVIRKEFGLDVSDDTTLKDLKVLGYNIKFDPVKKDYVVKIKREKSLVITAVPSSNRAEVFIRGNDELTGFSTVRVKVVAENGKFETYSIDIKKDAFNKTIEIASIIVGCVIILISSCIIVIKKKARIRKEYFEE